MRIKLTFEEDDKENAELAMKARSMHNILCDLDRELRSKIKHGDHSEEVRDAYQEIRDLLREMIQQENIPF
jgi:hypothetical protein